MKCNEFIDKLECLSQTDIPQEMEKHMAECDDCKAYYAVIYDSTPRVSPKTPESIKTNVLKKIKRNQQLKTFFAMKNKASRIAASVAGIAAVVLSIVFVGKSTQAHAVENMIDKSLASVGNIKNMVMKIDVRTELKENFSYININDLMVQHTLTMVRGITTKWRLDKGWRSIVFDGMSKYMWTPDSSINVKGGKGASFEEWFEILLDPEKTLLLEKITAKDKEARYAVTESGDDIIMSVQVKAKGDFTNPYLYNTSIEESDTRREIVFDKQTNLIKSMKIFVKDNSREILVVDIKSIEYNVNVNETELMALPEDRQWCDVNAAVESSGTFTGITPEKAAEIIFRAFENNDPKSAKYALTESDAIELFKVYGGIKVIHLGKSFKSGSYPGVFVPYKIKMPDGSIKKHNIALRNDNQNKQWVVDGGV